MLCIDRVSWEIQLEHSDPVWEVQIKFSGGIRLEEFSVVKRGGSVLDGVNSNV